jgi:hypothetical protein
MRMVGTELDIRCRKCILDVALAAEDIETWERALNLDERSHGRRRRKLSYRIPRLF